LNGFCVADNVGDGRTNDGKDSYPCSRSQIESTILATKDQAGSPHLTDPSRSWMALKPLHSFIIIIMLNISEAAAILYYKLHYNSNSAINLNFEHKG